MQRSHWSRVLNLRRYSAPVALYTFGSPRVGNRSFAYAFDRMVPDSWRVVYQVSSGSGTHPWPSYF